MYFTVCPHCGFNYRIEITPVKPGRDEDKRSAAALYAFSATVPMAGFVVGAVLSGDGDDRSRTVANGCIALAALNMMVVPLLIIECFGLA